MENIMFDVWTISNLVIAELIKKTVQNCNIIKVNSENLVQNGELSLPHNLNAWKCIFQQQCCDKCINILQHYLHLHEGMIQDLSQTELIERVSQYLTLASHKWPLQIEKCSLQKEKICLFLNRPSTIKVVLTSALNNGSNFGQGLSTNKAYDLAVLPDNESELTNMRLHLIRDVSEKILRLQGYNVSKDTSLRRIMFTVKSQGTINENYERYVCGVVENSETKGKDISFTWKNYITNKINEVERLNQDKCLLEEYDGQKNEFLKNIAKATVVFELLAVKPNRSVYVNNINSEKSIMSMKEASFILYNVARIANILERYHQDVFSGAYPSLPDIQDVDFSQLDEEEEWELVYNYILRYPGMIQECIIHQPNLRVSPQCLCLFLSRLCHKFSVYYRRVRILTEGREHLIPKMFARLYMLKILQIVLHNALSILDIHPIFKM